MFILFNNKDFQHWRKYLYFTFDIITEDIEINSF